MVGVKPGLQDKSFPNDSPLSQCHVKASIALPHMGIRLESVTVYCRDLAYLEYLFSSNR
jgi:hypothetical protein